MGNVNYKTSLELLWIGAVIGAIVGFFSHLFGLGLIIASFVQACIFYRCPHCKYRLIDVRGMIPNCCPNCGENLP